MTITSDIQSVSYATDGATTSFPIPFYFLSEEDIVANLLSAQGITSLALGTDFTILGAGSTSGGTIILSATFAAGKTLRVQRIVPVTQETQFQQNDAFPAQTVEKALDKLTMIDQQNADAIENSIRFPLVEYGTNGVLPTAPNRANKVLSFDSAGNPSLLPIPTSLGAGDMHDELGSDGKPGFKPGVDFTVGVTTSLQLSRAYGTRDNVFVDFDASSQGANTFSLANQTLTFDGPLPNVTVFVKGGTTVSQTVPPDGSVTDVKVPSGANINATKLAFQRAGGVLRTLFDELSDREVNVKDYGAVGDGVADDTNAIAACIATVGPATIYFPPGTYRTSGLHTLGVGQYLKGAGQSATNIQCISPTNDVFGMPTSFSGIRDLAIIGLANQSAGRFIVCAGGQSGPNIIENVFLVNYFVGIQLYSTRTFISNITAINAASTSSTIIWINGGGDYFIEKISADTSINPAYGILILACGGLWISDCDFIHCTNGVAITPTGSAIVSDIFFSNVCCDTSGNNAWVLTTAGTAVIRRLAFENCWGSSAANTGFLVQGNGGLIDGLFFTNWQGYNNGLDGVYLQSGVQNVSFIGGALMGNSVAAANAHFGMHIGANINAIAVLGMRIGPGQNFPDIQLAQIQVDAGNGTQIQIVGCNLSTANTAVTMGATGSNNVIEGCVGFLLSGFYSGATDAAGFVTITHNVGAVPKSIVTSVSNTGAAIFAQPDLATANTANFRVKFFTQAGASMANTAVAFSWRIGF